MLKTNDSKPDAASPLGLEMNFGSQRISPVPRVRN